MGIEQAVAEKLLSFKSENDEPVYDSAFKFTDLCEDVFIEKVKDIISEQEAKDIYLKALARREFVSRYIENAREMTEPHYRAQRACNIDHNTAASATQLYTVYKENNNMTTDSNVVETIFKTQEGYNECDHCQSVLSPAAYFVKLMETIEKYVCLSDSLDKLGIEQEKIDKLMNFKKEDGKSLFDSACKITSLTEEAFIEKVKDEIPEQEKAKDIYQKAKASRRSALEQLKTRRPDLFELKLDCDSTNKTKLYLEIVNEIMQKNLDSKLGKNTLQKLATAKYPFNLPANFPLTSIRAYLEKQGITLADLLRY